MALDIDEKKKKIYEEQVKNRKIVRILKCIVYVLSAILLVDMLSFFIFGVMMEKTNMFFDHLAFPIAIILFGIIAILLTQINPRLSRTTNTKGDKGVFLMGIVITIIGIIYLFLEIF